MFSKKMAIIFGVTAMFIVSIVFLSATRQSRDATASGGAIGIFIVAPFQDAFISTVRFSRNVWNQYFFLVSTAKENRILKKQLRQVISQNNQYAEIALANQRLRRLLNFHEKIKTDAFAAEVVARDPSAWFQTVIIDKGGTDKVERNMPVVVSEGVVGQVVDVAPDYAKVLLIIDPNSSIDALCQRTRARGIVKGAVGKQCDFEYVLKTDDVKEGDVLISSGLDGVYPKGIRIGRVSSVIKNNADIFQSVGVEPYVDFDKLEEVLVITNSSRPQAFQIQ